MTLAEEDVEACARAIARLTATFPSHTRAPSEYERIVAHAAITTFLSLQAKKGLELLPREATADE